MRQSLFNEIIKHQRHLVQCNGSKIKSRNLCIYVSSVSKQKIFYYSGSTWQLSDIKGRVKHK